MDGRSNNLCFSYLMILKLCFHRTRGERVVVMVASETCVTVKYFVVSRFFFCSFSWCRIRVANFYHCCFTLWRSFNWFQIRLILLKPILVYFGERTMPLVIASDRQVIIFSFTVVKNLSAWCHHCLVIVLSTFFTADLEENTLCQFLFSVLSWYLSRLVTKPTKWLCAQRRLRSAWASAQSD